MIPMERLIGTWSLVDSRAHDDNGQPLPSPYGPVKMGLLMLGANGRMIAVLCDSRPEMPSGEPREYSSYCGAYTFDGATLTTHVDASAEPGRVGGDQVRAISFEGDRLVLAPPPRPYKGTHMHRQMLWERLA